MDEDRKERRAASTPRLTERLRGGYNRPPPTPKEMWAAIQARIWMRPGPGPLPDEARAPEPGLAPPRWGGRPRRPRPSWRWVSAIGRHGRHLPGGGGRAARVARAPTPTWCGPPRWTTWAAPRPAHAGAERRPRWADGPGGGALGAGAAGQTRLLLDSPAGSDPSPCGRSWRTWRWSWPRSRACPETTESRAAPGRSWTSRLRAWKNVTSCPGSRPWCRWVRGFLEREGGATWSEDDDDDGCGPLWRRCGDAAGPGAPARRAGRGGPGSRPGAPGDRAGDSEPHADGAAGREEPLAGPPPAPGAGGAAADASAVEPAGPGRPGVQRRAGGPQRPPLRPRRGAVRQIRSRSPGRATLPTRTTSRRWRCTGPGAPAEPAGPGAPGRAARQQPRRHAAATPTSSPCASGPPWPSGRRRRGRGREASAQEACDGQDQDLRATALSALLTMDAARAKPILMQVLQNRDACSAELRKRAVFLVAQKLDADAVDILLDLAAAEPGPRPGGAGAGGVLALPGADPRGGGRPGVHPGRTARTRTSRRRPCSPSPGTAAPGGAGAAELRGARRRAVGGAGAGHLLAGHGPPAGVAWLEQLYGRIQDPDLKEKVVFGVAQAGARTAAPGCWSGSGTRPSRVDARKNALFWAERRRAASGGPPGAVLRSVKDPESGSRRSSSLSRDDAAAVDALMDIARNDPDPDLRKKAVFWLGRSKDPRATFLLTEAPPGGGARWGPLAPPRSSSRPRARRRRRPGPGAPGARPPPTGTARRSASRCGTDAEVCDHGIRVGDAPAGAASTTANRSAACGAKRRRCCRSGAAGGGRGPAPFRPRGCPDRDPASRPRRRGLPPVRGPGGGLDPGRPRRPARGAPWPVTADGVAGAPGRRPGAHRSRAACASAALFWVGQEAGDRWPPPWVPWRTDPDEDREVRDAAVFALSQRPADEAIPALMELARTAPDPETRRSAMFWLSRSDDPRVVPFFEAILAGRPNWSGPRGPPGRAPGGEYSVSPAPPRPDGDGTKLLPARGLPQTPRRRGGGITVVCPGIRLA